MDFAAFDHPRPEISPEEAEQLAAELYGIEGTAEPLHGERDRSFKLVAGAGTFVLRVGNPADRPDALEAQSGAMLWVRAADPDLPVPEVVPNGQITGRHATQLTRFIDGVAPAGASTPPGLRRNLGTLAARLSAALRGYDHPALHRPFPWNLTQLPQLRPLLEFVDPDRRGVLDDALGRFEAETVPRLGRLGSQAVHGDLHDDNLVVDPIDPEMIVGVFDFGDMSWAPRVIELAVAATYQCFGADPAQAIAQVAAAFHTVTPLDDAEIDLLPDLVAGRCVQSLLMAARHVATHPENREYATADADQMWETLVRLGDADRAAVVGRVSRACGRGRDLAEASLDDALALRHNRLGPGLRLSYTDPVRLSRGSGVWLTDTDGNRLLDAYNNVPHVGHSHPEVVAAISAQLGRLTTNTRYLVDSVAAYADRLAGLLPDPLDTVMFVNSGSEANDLAYQIARAVTGRRGVITTEHAYHGTTFATISMSPEEFAPGQLEPWAERVPGQETLESDDPPERLGAELEAATARLAATGHEPAMAIFDTVASSEGIYSAPAGYLRQARTWADASGALLVADEVQAGFGRIGSAIWGFASDGVIPDIVTLGKPMGNGYPMGAVVTTAAIAAEFADRWHFFSTFAGSPVAAAAGDAVLDVTESERLPQRADEVGSYLRARLADLKHPLVRTVRGPGLFIGVEMPDGAVAQATVDGMRARGVLIGTTGPKRNVLKIRPPLVFAEHHADLLVARLAETLASVE